MKRFEDKCAGKDKSRAQESSPQNHTALNKMTNVQTAVSVLLSGSRRDCDMFGGSEVPARRSLRMYVKLDD